MRNPDYDTLNTLGTTHGGVPLHPLIIERPDLQPRKQRALFTVVTAMFWVLWVVLWLPLITLLAWAFFGYQFRFHMLALDGYHGFLDVLGAYAMVIVAMGGGLLLWAKYNHLRFRGVDRRQGFAPPTAADLAKAVGATESDILQWQALRIVTVHHDADGKIKAVMS